MRYFWWAYVIFVVLPRVALPVFFWLLAITTAPEDTSELLREGREVIEELAGTLWIDLIILTIGALGLLTTFGWGNWRAAIHRYFARARLERVASDAERVAQDIANTLSQEQNRRDIDMNLGRPSDIFVFGKDSRYLSKHMMEAHFVIQALKEMGYWQPQEEFHEIGVAGATTFAAETTCKALYAAAQRIRADLQDGLIAILTQPSVNKN